jgi:predicted transcriptional regulator
MLSKILHLEMVKEDGSMLPDIIEIYDDYRDLGIINRKITEGKEIELVKDYIDYRKNRFTASSCKKLAIFIETKIDNSYPDIVFVEYNPNNYSDWNDGRESLNKDDLKLLYHIYARNSVQASDIVSQLGLTWKTTMLSIENLFDAELIMRKNKNWMITDVNKISTYKIEAVEAKLNHWDQVLQQSIINKNFASESYALSISETSLKKETLSKFRKFGIGVCLKHGDKFNIIKEAERASIPVNFNSIIFNEWIGRIINTKEQNINAIG